MLPALFFLLGLSIGSFLNVVICRLETKEPILKSRSHCPQCRAVLKWYDLIPLLSFLFQKGRCRYCGKKISLQYPMVEMASGLLFLQIFILHFSLLTLLYFLLITCFLIVIFVYDLKHSLIPDKIVYPAIIIALAYLSFLNSDLLLNHLWAVFLASGFFLSLVLVSQGKWMGLGDVKLAVLMGLILGWPNILLALFLAFVTGAMVGLTLIILGKKTIKSQIPFGPFLAGATIPIMLYSQYLTNWFQSLFYFNQLF